MYVCMYMYYMYVLHVCILCIVTVHGVSDTQHEFLGCTTIHELYQMNEQGRSSTCCISHNYEHCQITLVVVNFFTQR